MTEDHAAQLVADGAKIVAAAITAARAIVEDQGLEADPWEVAQEILSVATEEPAAVSPPNPWISPGAPPNGAKQ